MTDSLIAAVAAANAEWARAERYRLAWLSARRRATLNAFGYSYNDPRNCACNDPKHAGPHLLQVIDENPAERYWGDGEVWMDRPDEPVTPAQFDAVRRGIREELAAEAADEQARDDQDQP